MRKSHAPRFVKVYNALLQQYHLSPPALKVYLYFSGMWYWKQSVQLRYATVADKCGMSVGSVRKAITELVSKGLLQVTSCFGDRNKREANEYWVRRLTGQYARLDMATLWNEPDCSALSILCSTRIRANHAGKSFPSYKQISEDTGLSRRTVIYKIKYLQQRLLLCKERYITRSGDHGHNNYRILDLPVRVIFYVLLSKLAISVAPQKRAISRLWGTRRHCVQRAVGALKQALNRFAGFVKRCWHKLCGCELAGNTS